MAYQCGGCHGGWNGGCGCHGGVKGGCAGCHGGWNGGCGGYHGQAAISLALLALAPPNIASQKACFSVSSSDVFPSDSFMAYQCGGCHGGWNGGCGCHGGWKGGGGCHG